MTRLQINQLVQVFEANASHGLPIAIEAVAHVAVSMHGDTDDSRTPITSATLKAARLVIAAVAESYEVPLKRLMSQCQWAYVAACRRECCVRLRAMGLSTPAIGRLLKRDHSTVLAALARFEELRPGMADELAARREAA